MILRKLIGQSLGHYQIINLLGEDGMGAVFKDYDPSLESQVAIKIMHPHLVQQLDFQARFMQEARAIALLRDPGIVKIFDMGQADTFSYIVMEFIPGHNLKQTLQW